MYDLFYRVSLPYKRSVLNLLYLSVYYLRWSGGHLLQNVDNK